MSIHRLRSALRYTAEQAGEQWAQPRLGLMTDYDPTTGSVKVQLQPENVETGWIPLKPLWQGNGWGFFAPPPQGSQVVVIFQEAHPDNGICLGAIPSDEDRPLPVPAGEAWFQHESGAFVRLTNDGAATISDGAGASVKLAGGAIASSGPWTHTGSITATEEITAMSQGAAVALSTHQHGVTGGAETTQPLPGGA